MIVYKRRTISRGIKGMAFYEYYRVDITDYVFIEYVVRDSRTGEYILTPFVQSRITNEFEVLYVKDPYTDTYGELCGITGRILEKYWKLMYRSI